MNMLKVSLHCALGDFFIQLFLIWVICVAFATVLAFYIQFTQLHERDANSHIRYF